MASFMGLGAISQRVGLHPSGCRTSAGLSAMDLATAISDEWQSWRFGCEAECCGLTWTSATLATILGLGPHYRTTALRGGAAPHAGSSIAMPGHYDHFHYVYSDRNARPYAVTSDGSVCNTPSLLTPNQSNETEIVSPPMTFANGDFEDWAGVLLMLRGLGGITGDGEGGHVHIDAAPIFDGVDAKTQAHRIGVYLAEFARWEPLIQAAMAMHPARRRWAEPVASRIQECLPGLATTGLPGLKRCWLPQGNFRHSDPRYRAVNLMNARDIQENPSLKNTIELRMPNGTLEPERWLAYVQLALALGVLAKTAKRAARGSAVAVDPQTARYDFRVWLLALGLSGPQFKVMRDRLGSNLPGDAAWKPPKKVQPGAGITGATDPRALLRARSDPAMWAAHPDGSFWVTSGSHGAATVQKTTEGRYLPIALVDTSSEAVAVFPIEGQPLERMAVGRTLQPDSAALVRGPTRICREIASWRKGYPTLAAAQTAALAAGPVGGSQTVAASGGSGGGAAAPAASTPAASGFAPSPQPAATVPPRNPEPEPATRTRARAVPVPTLHALQEAVVRRPIPSSLFLDGNMRITAPWGADDLGSRILTTAAGRGEELRLTYETRAQASFAAGLLSSGMRGVEAISAVPMREVDVASLSSGRAVVEHRPMRHTHLRHYLKAILNAPGLVDVTIVPR